MFLCLKGFSLEGFFKTKFWLVNFGLEGLVLSLAFFSLKEPTEDSPQEF